MMKYVEDKIDLEVKENVYFEEMRLDTLRDHVDRLIKKYGEGAYIEKEYFGHDGGFDIFLYFTRLETESEYKKRINQEQKEKQKMETDKQKKEEKDRKEYERLKKKFEE